jgi:hypothetical protein
MILRTSEIHGLRWASQWWLGCQDEIVELHMTLTDPQYW